eukprot:466913_1
MTHLLQIFESNSITNIKRNHFVDNNKCDNYCLYFMDSNLEIDQYSASISTAFPTSVPSTITISPTTVNTEEPTINPTFVPSNNPTMEPIIFVPSNNPTMEPTTNPTHYPTFLPISIPTFSPTVPTREPTNQPTTPTTYPTLSPTYSFKFVGFGHLHNSSNYNTLYLNDFKPKLLLQTIDLINFGSNNGSVIYNPCDSSNTLNFNGLIIFDEITENMEPNHFYEDNKLQEILQCTDLMNCFIECAGLCIGSKIISNSVQYTLVSCSSTFSCLQSIFHITESNNVHILCKGDSSCKDAVIEAKYVGLISIECLSHLSCLSATINITNASEIEIRCYSPNACDSITIYSDSNHISLKFYHYNH